MEVNSFDQEPDGSALSLPERQMAMKDIFIEHDRYKDAELFIQRTHYPVEGGLPDYGRIAVMFGDSRAGKTSVANRYMKKFILTEGEGGLGCPVASVTVSSEGHKALLMSLADALRIVYSNRIPTPALQVMIVNQLLRLKVELLVFDEANTVVVAQNRSSTRLMLNLFRKLVDQCHLNIICIGLTETYNILAADPQITGRGGLRCHEVLPYNWDSEEERDLFRLLCDEFDRRLPFQERSNLGQRWFAERLFLSTEQGIIGRLHDFIYSAGCLALNDSAPRIEVKHFAEAYEHMTRESFNPWVHDLTLAPKKKEPSILRGKRPRDVFSKTVA